MASPSVYSIFRYLLHDLCYNVPHAQVRGIDVHRIRRGDQRRNAPGCVAPVALGKVSEKGAQGSMDSFVDQLLMSALGTLLEARGEEYFEPGVGEHDASHVAALGHQAGRLPNARWRARSAVRTSRSGATSEARMPQAFVAHCIRHVLSGEKGPLAAKLDREIAGEPGKTRLVVCSDALAAGSQARPACTAPRSRDNGSRASPQPPRDRSFSGRGRTVDCNDRAAGSLMRGRAGSGMRHHSHASVTRRQL
jgi:hypothetical protein